MYSHVNIELWSFVFPFRIIYVIPLQNVTDSNRKAERRVFPRICLDSASKVNV